MVRVKVHADIVAEVVVREVIRRDGDGPGAHVPAGDERQILIDGDGDARQAQDVIVDRGSGPGQAPIAEHHIRRGGKAAVRERVRGARIDIGLLGHGPAAAAAHKAHGAGPGLERDDQRYADRGP